MRLHPRRLLLLLRPYINTTTHYCTPPTRSRSLFLTTTTSTTATMSWMDSWSRPSKHQPTPAPYYLLPGRESTPYCRTCGRAISSRKAASAAASAPEAKYCSARCRSHKPGRLDRQIEAAFVRFLDGAETVPSAAAGGGGEGEGGGGGRAKKGGKKGGGKAVKGDRRVLVPCDAVQACVFGGGGEKGGEEGADEDASSGAVEAEHQQDNDTQKHHHHHPTPPNNSNNNNSPSSTPHDPDHSSNPSLSPSTSLPSSPPPPFQTLPPPAQDEFSPTSTIPKDLDPDVLARLSVRSGTRLRPAQSVSLVNGSVGGEKGRAERRAAALDDDAAAAARGRREVREREMVRSAARRGVVFGFDVVAAAGIGSSSDSRRKCEAVMQGKVVEPSFAKGSWGVRWRED